MKARTNSQRQKTKQASHNQRYLRWHSPLFALIHAIWTLGTLGLSRLLELLEFLELSDLEAWKQSVSEPHFLSALSYHTH